METSVCRNSVIPADGTARIRQAESGDSGAWNLPHREYLVEKEIARRNGEAIQKMSTTWIGFAELVNSVASGCNNPSVGA